MAQMRMRSASNNSDIKFESFSNPQAFIMTRAVRAVAIDVLIRRKPRMVPSIIFERGFIIASNIFVRSVIVRWYIFIMILCYMICGKYATNLVACM